MTRFLVPDGGREETVVLRIDRAERLRIDRGIFVRLDLPRPIPLALGGIAATVLVGRVSGSLRAYANVCRHTAIPLDARGGTSLGVMTENGENLFCDSHGAVYRPEDGLCILGPCAGTHLVAFAIAEDDDEDCLRITPTAG